MTAQPRTELKVALDLMTTHGFNHLPVTDTRHRYIGVVREHAVRAALGESRGGTPPRGILELTELGLPVLHEDETAEQAWGVLSRSPALNPLPVVREGRLVGTISHQELLRALTGMPPREEAVFAELAASLDEWAARSSPAVPRSNPRQNGLAPRLPRSPGEHSVRTKPMVGRSPMLGSG